MHYKLVNEKPKTFVLVFETNDELAGGLEKFASEQLLWAARQDGRYGVTAFRFPFILGPANFASLAIGTGTLVWLARESARTKEAQR